MKVSPTSCWDSALMLIEKNVSPDQFNTWFKPIVFESFNEETKVLLIRVASSFVYEYLEENYGNLLIKVLTRTFGKGISLSYRIVTDKEHAITQVVEGEAVDMNPSRKRATVKAAPMNPFEETPLKPIDSQLNPKKTFENFIEGDSNKLPRAIGLNIAEHPNNTQFNPMFIYGPSGCGKTHLVNAIGMRTKQLYPQKRVLYISARLFQVQYSNAVLQNATTDFINFYQTIDLLIVDDVQEWVTAVKTQDTFFHIFNHLFRNGKRIILASDRPPVDLRGMNERLITRFSCGLIAEMERPNVQLCIDILNSKIRRDGLQIPQDVVTYIAESANGSVRDLEGVINSLLAYSVVYNSDINMALAERVIKRAVKRDNEPLTIDDIMNTVCSHFHVTTDAVSGPSRKKELVEARQVSMYMAQKYTKMPASRIGKLVGGRDHSTVLHSCSKVEKRMRDDEIFLGELKKIEKKFKLKQ